MNVVIPLLTIATGFDDIYHGNLWGCTWISGAGIIAMMGTIFLRKAEGMKLHEVKASETRNRARAMARRMGIESPAYLRRASRAKILAVSGGRL